MYESNINTPFDLPLYCTSFNVVIEMYESINNCAGLQNDHKNVMKEIEAGLYQVHAAAREQKASSTRTEEPMVTDDAGYNSSTRPFIKVNRVDHGSPAAESVRN